MTDKKLRNNELKEIYDKWFADLYELEETETEDVLLLLSLLGSKSLKVLEPACGSGRILVPLAKAGHQVHGFDLDETMLLKIPDLVKGLTNATYSSMDALTGNWGSDYDAVVLGGNLLINIESALSYQQAQQLLIQKAADCLKPGGHLFLDFNLYSHPEEVFSKNDGYVIFEGTDSRGVSGKYTVIGDSYDTVTQMAAGRRHIELRMPDGSLEVLHETYQKHVPTLQDVQHWLKDAGFITEYEFGSYQREPLSKNTVRCILYACKNA